MNLAAVSLVGLALFLWPFVGLDAPGLPAIAVATAALVAFTLVEIGARRLDSGRLALLATLAAIDAGLRLALVNGLAGFSPIFFLILVAGYVFGPSYGFLVGAFALLVSAVATGGVGPWLPYEMFAAGWVGVAAGVTAGFTGRGGPDGWRPRRRDLAALTAVAIVTGFAYGALTDVWEWSAYFRGVPDIGWQPGTAPLEAAATFARFYVVTSFVWDCFRAFGDAIAILVLGAPVLMGLGRLRARFGYEIVPAAPNVGAPPAAPPTPRSTPPSATTLRA